MGGPIPDRSEASMKFQKPADFEQAEAKTAIGDNDDEFSEISFIGFKRTERRKKCHHLPPEIPSNCSSVADIGEEQDKKIARHLH